MNKKPVIVEDSVATDKLKRRHESVQAQVDTLPEDQKKKVKALQAEVDVEVAKMNEELDAQFDIEDKWRAATGLHHNQAKEVLETMSRQPVGKMVFVHGHYWVHTPFKTIVKAQEYIDALQWRVIDLVNDFQSEAVVHQLVVQRAKIVEALRSSSDLMDKANQTIDSLKKDSVTNYSAFGLIKLSIKRLLRRG